MLATLMLVGTTQQTQAGVNWKRIGKNVAVAVGALSVVGILTAATYYSGLKVQEGGKLIEEGRHLDNEWLRTHKNEYIEKMLLDPSPSYLAKEAFLKIYLQCPELFGEKRPGYDLIYQGSTYTPFIFLCLFSGLATFMAVPECIAFCADNWY